MERKKKQQPLNGIKKAQQHKSVTKCLSVQQRRPEVVAAAFVALNQNGSVQMRNVQ